MTQSRQRGLTLIELMTAMAIFAMLGGFLFTLMRDSLGIYRKSRSSGEIYDKYDQVSQALQDDLTCVAIGDPEGPGIKLEFLQSRDRQYVPSKDVTLSKEALATAERASGDPRSFLLRFVRSFPGGEMNDTVGRFAGTYPGASQSIDGDADLAESRHGAIIKAQLKEGKPSKSDNDQKTPGLKPPGNLMEVMYFCENGPYDEPGTFTLYRAFRSPVGGSGSFCDDATIKAMTPEWIERYAKPVVSGLVYFGAVLWGQDTKQWDIERVLNGDGIGGRVSTGLSELWWDSRRARYPNFSMHIGDKSALFYEDDVFPRRIQFLMTFVQGGKVSPDARLLGSLRGTSRNLTLDNGKIFDNSGGGAVPTHLLIDNEWMEVSSGSGSRLTVVRGSRRTAPAKHETGSAVHVGRSFKLTVDIPAYRFSFDSQGGGR